MAKNEFLPFGTGANANVLSNADYQALPARATGFSSGVAKSEQLNKAWRQATVMASVLGQFIADTSGNDVLDDGNMATLKNSLIAALNTQATGRLLNIRTITADGTYTPTVGTKKIKVTLTGGGASGGKSVATTSYARSGGAGGTRIAFIDAPASTVVIIGTGGQSTTTAGSVGFPGGNSSFGSLMLALGGTTSFGIGGGSSGSGFGFAGGNGNNGSSQSNNTFGGASYWGGGGSGYDPQGESTLNAAAPGSGGAGVNSGATGSGSGASGICIIEEYS